MRRLPYLVAFAAWLGVVGLWAGEPPANMFWPGFALVLGSSIIMMSRLSGPRAVPQAGVAPLSNLMVLEAAAEESIGPSNTISARNAKPTPRQVSVAYDCLKAFYEFGLIDRELDLAAEADEIVRALGPDCEVGDVFEHVLADHTVSFVGEAFDTPGDHAGLVSSVAEATGGAFHVEAAESSVEADGAGGYRVTVSFIEHGERVQWRFAQSGDRLPEAFLRQLQERVARRTESEFLDLSTSDVYRWVCLPKPVISGLRSKVGLRA
jgi:hypothetical protein